MLSEVIKSIRTLEVSTTRQVDQIFSGNYKSAFKGRGLEFADIREYQIGDEVRHIDWRTSARKSGLYVKQFQETRELSMIFLVDVSGSMFFGSGEHTKLDLLLRVIATLSLSAVKSNDQIGAFFFQENVIKSLPPRKGRGYFWRLLSTLHSLRDQMVYHESNPVEALKHLHHSIKRRSIVFLLTDQLDLQDEELKKWLRITRLRHDFVVGQIQDKAETVFPMSGTFYLEDPETGERELVDFSSKKARNRFAKLMQKIEKEQSEGLSSLGVDRLKFDDPDRIFSTLYTFFRVRQQRY